MSRIEKKRRNNLFDILSWNLQGLRNFQIIYRRKKEGCQRLLEKRKHNRNPGMLPFRIDENGRFNYQPPPSANTGST